MVTGTLSEYPRKCAISKTSAAAQSSERERNVHTETSLTASGKSPQLVPQMSLSAVTVELQRKVSHYLQPILSHQFLNNLA